MYNSDEEDTASKETGARIHLLHEYQRSSASITTKRLETASVRSRTILFVVVSTVLLAVINAFLWWLYIFQLDRVCLARTSADSPLLKVIPSAPVQTLFNGSLDWPSIYRGEPSNELDQAWERVSILRPLDVDVDLDKILPSHVDRESLVRNAPEFGGSIFVVPEFTHQIHCLNFLRKVSPFRWEYYKDSFEDFKLDPQLFEVHIDHCVEMLRQILMCKVDVGLVTAHWLDDRVNPYPDFNTKHQCRDFETILESTKRLQLPEGTPLIPVKPLGAKGLAFPP